MTQSELHQLLRLQAQLIAELLPEPKQPAPIIPTEPNSSNIGEYMAKNGQKGGKARLQTMTAEQRSECGRHAVQVRWARAKAAQQQSIF